MPIHLRIRERELVRGKLQNRADGSQRRREEGSRGIASREGARRGGGRLRGATGASGLEEKGSVSNLSIPFLDL